MSAVRIFLGQDPDVGHENEPRIFGRLDRFFRQRIPAARSHEKQTALAAAVRRLAQMLGEIKRRIVCLPFVLKRDGLPLESDPRNVFLIEKIGNLKPRMLEFPFGLADKMINLRGSDARNFIFDRIESAGANR